MNKCEDTDLRAIVARQADQELPLFTFHAQRVIGKGKRWTHGGVPGSPHAQSRERYI